MPSVVKRARKMRTMKCSWSDNRRLLAGGHRESHLGERVGADRPRVRWTERWVGGR